MATVCRQDIFKGVDVALRVLAGERWRRREWVFDVYGEGPLRGYLEGLARYLGHDERRVDGRPGPDGRLAEGRQVERAGGGVPRVAVRAEGPGVGPRPSPVVGATWR